MDELADRAGIGKSTICAIENGTNIPRMDTALLIARALETDVGRLFYFAEEEANGSGNGGRHTEGNNVDAAGD